VNRIDTYSKSFKQNALA